MNLLKTLLSSSDEKKTFNILFYISVVVFIILSFLRIFNSTGYILDTYEHIHASWLVSQGLIPYRDFFEHHNPLLWYLFAPLTKLFYRDVNIIYIARFIAVLGYFITLFLLYVVALKYCKSNMQAKFSIIFMLFFPCFWMDIQNLRPDIFMYISILLAILFIFNYLDTKKTRYLSYSYLAWFISFLFLQKAVIYGFAFFVANIFLITKKDIKLKDALISSIIPLILSSCLLFIAYDYNILENWYKFNIYFNMKMKENFGSYHSGVNPQKMRLILILLSFVMIRYFKYSSKGIILLTMWVCGFLQVLYFAPHPQYFLFNYLIFSMLISPIMCKLYCKMHLIVYICCIIFLSISSFYMYNSSKSSSSVKSEINFIEYILENTKTTDTLPPSNTGHNLFNPNMHFHWLGLYTITMLADLYLDYNFDYNSEIKKHKPKLLFISSNIIDRILYSNTYHVRIRNDALFKKASKGDLSYLEKISKIDYDYWNIDMNFVQKNYKHIKTFRGTELWQRIDN